MAFATSRKHRAYTFQIENPLQGNKAYSEDFDLIHRREASKPNVPSISLFACVPTLPHHAPCRAGDGLPDYSCKSDVQPLPVYDPVNRKRTIRVNEGMEGQPAQGQWARIVGAVESVREDGGEIRLRNFSDDR